MAAQHTSSGRSRLGIGQKFIGGIGHPEFKGATLWCGKLLTIMLLLGLTACSTTSFVYNRLHIVIPWFIDDYVSLTSVQDDQLEVLLKGAVQQNRQYSLPKYIAVIDQLIIALDEPLSREIIMPIYRQVVVEMTALKNQTLTWMLALGQTLSEAQIDEFVDQLQQQLKRDEEQYLSRDTAEYHRQNYQRLKDVFDNFLGSLDEQQLHTLRQASEQLQRADSQWLEQRKQRHTALAGILRQRESGWEIRVLQLLDEPAETQADLPSQAYQFNLQLLMDASATVINNRSERQDRYLRSKLNRLRGDLVKLNR
ncbi:MAG: DUF6279 family lipoprotein [Spongiibacteraceae bacterium]